MKPHLLQPSSSPPRSAQPPAQWAEVSRDLEIDTLIDAMAAGDAYVRGAVAAVIPEAVGVGDAAVVAHRQAALRDVLARSEAIGELYGKVVAAIDSRKQHLFGLDMLGRYGAGTTLRAAADMLQDLIRHLQQLRDASVRMQPGFASEAFCDLFAQLETQLDAEWMEQARGQLDTLRFADGMLFGAALGRANHLTTPVLYAGGGNRPSWWARLLRKAPSAFTFRLHPRDEAGARALSELGDRVIAEVANAVAQAAEHVFAFLEVLRAELAFYLGCARLHAHLRELGVATCMPGYADPSVLRATALRDPSLALTMARAPAANDFDAGTGSFLVITGANQGGKSTFLRALGLAQLMLQAGMFVTAESYTGALSSGLFTHYKREEDQLMQGGKLDEELVRMSATADHIRPGAVWLSNESFSSTNEREGSQLLLDVVEALREREVSVRMVTHLLAAAQRLASTADAVCLRAPRAQGGVRTYQLEIGAPLQTSFASDVYAEVFGPDETTERSP